MTRIPDEVIEEVRLRARVSDVAREIGGVQLKRKGGELVGLCPFHNDRSPSMTVNDAKGLFKCFACGAGGDAIAFVMRLEGLDFPGAVARIAPHYGIAVSAEASPATQAEAAARRAMNEHRRAGMAVLTALAEAVDLKNKLKIARDIWVAAEDSPALALRYLATRGIRPRALPIKMRAHRALFHTPSRRTWPSIVTYLEGPYGFHGVHRTYLAEDGTAKAPVEDAKMTLGSVFETGACARLQSVTQGRVALVEGLENALILAQALRTTAVHARREAGEFVDPGRQAARVAWPVWSVLALEGFRRVVLPEFVHTVLVVPDADESDRAAAEAIIQEAIWRFQSEGRTVCRFNTPEGHDLDSMRTLPAVWRPSCGRACPE